MSRFPDTIKRLHRYLPVFVPTAVVLALILWLTLAPHPVGDMEVPWFEGVDKVVHSIMFFALTLTALFDEMRMKGWNAVRLPLISMTVVAGGVIGCIIEILQDYLGMGRSMEFLDAVADCFGAVLAGILWIVIEQAHLRRHSFKGRTQDNSDNNN